VIGPGPFQYRYGFTKNNIIRHLWYLLYVIYRSCFPETRQAIAVDAICNHRSPHRARVRRMPIPRSRITLALLTSVPRLMDRTAARYTALTRWIGIFMTQEAD